MLSRTTPRLLRLTSRVFLQPLPPALTTLTPRTLGLRTSRTPTNAKPFTSSTSNAKGIQPDSEDPKPPNVHGAPVAGAASHVTEPTPLSPEEYYDVSEHYFNVLLSELERAQEDGSDVEAEYSVCAPHSAVLSPCFLLLHPHHPY